ncbi:LpxL/LpxP family acyltransferase [Aequorivita echinoideorum]|uniref:Lipid A biosynthesis acyltransferase n=1 Tax=Aequorivita echinoideorum TaxID=1549647 RepID=A0ABS5S5V1_9FLAO|nr:lipid A biosynthesis acyltransferase [Aequorivita echinoideorum]MBT0607752.1 lipid A biosynthesis acyltransferase [Aequorivita echinoideorum]
MAANWEGKSKGTVFGYKIFIFLLKNLGINAAYALLFFVAFYYTIFSVKSTTSIFYYFRKRLKYSFFKSAISVFKNYLVFGKTIIDKVAISSGLRNKYTYNFDGIENLKNLLKQKKGGILISAHVGNFEIADYFLDELAEDAKITLLISDAEHQAIKEYMQQFFRKSRTKFIIFKEDMSHIFEINSALANNEILCIAGDRFVKGSKFMKADFLGKKAKFPAGPFSIASRLNLPVLFVYVMREKSKHYHLYARTAQVKKGNAEDLLHQFTASVTGILEKYPLQWFNYFDFWEKERL